MNRIRQQRMIDDLMSVEKQWRVKPNHSRLSDYAPMWAMIERIRIELVDDLAEPEPDADPVDKAGEGGTGD